MIAEAVAAAVRAYEAEITATAKQHIRAAVEKYELECWELVRQQLEEGSNDWD